MHEIHSVILNLNQNFSNNKGSDFSQIVNKQLELKPNTLCALYTGNLVRKPIVLDEDTRMNLVINSGFLTRQQKLMTNIATNVVSDLNTNPSYTGYMRVDIPKGEYSKIEFCRVFTEKFNDEISVFFGEVATTVEPVVGSPAMNQCFPYRMYYEMRGDQFYLGLRYQLPENTETGNSYKIERYQVPFQNLDDSLLTTSNVTAVPGFVEQQVYKPNAGGTVGKYTDFLLGNCPLRGMAQGSIITDRPNDVAFATIGLKGSAPSKTCKFAFNLHNTYFSDVWGNNGGTNPAECEIFGISGESYPQAQISCILETVSDGSAYTGITAKVLVNENLKDLSILGTAGSTPYTNQADRDSFIQADFRILKEVDLFNDFEVDLLQYTELTWEVYMRQKGASASYDSPNNISEEARDYGFRLICNTPYGTDSPKAVIFDSKEVGLMLHRDVVETGYMFQQIDSYTDPISDQFSGGLCPQFYWSNCENDDLTLFNPTANMVAEYYDSPGAGGPTFLYYGGINSYSFFVPDSKEYKPNVNVSSLQNILGVADINRTISPATGLLITNPTGFNPNLFPKSPEQAGITQLGSDRMRYNIEVNLPVRAYNTTESETNDLGQIRNIVHNSNPVVEDVTNLSSGLVNRNLEPHDIKYLSLNNKEAIKLNTLDITIRRAKTNKIADEIIDASVELLFKSGEC